MHRERQGYWAQARGLEGCLASGETVDELLSALHEAIASHPDTLQLQYSQLVQLGFNDLRWPHVTVATLTKQ